MHFSPPIWEENGGASYSPNVAYLVCLWSGASLSPKNVVNQCPHIKHTHTHTATGKYGQTMCVCRQTYISRIYVIIPDSHTQTVTCTHLYNIPVYNESSCSCTYRQSNNCMFHLNTHLMLTLSQSHTQSCPFQHKQLSVPGQSMPEATSLAYSNLGIPGSEY